MGITLRHLLTSNSFEGGDILRAYLEQNEQLAILQRHLNSPKVTNVDTYKKLINKEPVYIESDARVLSPNVDLRYITGLSLPYITFLDNTTIKSNPNILYINLPSVTDIGEYTTLSDMPELLTCNMPKLILTEDNCRWHYEDRKRVPMVNYSRSIFFQNNNKLKELNISSAEFVDATLINKSKEFLENIIYSQNIKKLESPFTNSNNLRKIWVDKNTKIDSEHTDKYLRPYHMISLTCYAILDDHKETYWTSCNPNVIIFTNASNEDVIKRNCYSTDRLQYDSTIYPDIWRNVGTSYETKYNAIVRYNSSYQDFLNY